MMNTGTSTPTNLSILWPSIERFGVMNGVNNRCSFNNLNQSDIEGAAGDEGLSGPLHTPEIGGREDDVRGPGLSGPPHIISGDKHQVRQFSEGGLCRTSDMRNTIHVGAPHVPADERHVGAPHVLADEIHVGAPHVPADERHVGAPHVLADDLHVGAPHVPADERHVGYPHALDEDRHVGSPHGPVNDRHVGDPHVNRGVNESDRTRSAVEEMSMMMSQTFQQIMQRSAQQQAEVTLAGSGFERFDGSRPGDFRSWLFGIENRLKMTKTSDDAVKVGHLVNCLAGLARRQFHEDLERPTYEEAVVYLKEKYTDTRYNALKFQQFRSRTQHRGETIQTFARELKLAYPFSHADQQQTNLMLMEQLQRGVQDQDFKLYIQEHLLNPKKSFDDVVEKLSIRELAKKTATVPVKQERYRDSRNEDDRSHYCVHCRRKTDHIVSQCPFVVKSEQLQQYEAQPKPEQHQQQPNKESIQCFKCQEYGHYASTCSNKRVSPRVNDKRAYVVRQNSPFMSQGCVHEPQFQASGQQEYQGQTCLKAHGHDQIECQEPIPAIEYPPEAPQQHESVGTKKPHRLSVCRVRSAKIASERSPIYVNSQKVPDDAWHPDTGAKCNLVTSDFLYLIEGPLNVKPCSDTLTCINGLKTKCTGSVKFAVSIGNLTKQIQFYVIDEFYGKIGLVLGMPALNAFGFSLKNDSGFDLKVKLHLDEGDNFVGHAAFVVKKEGGRDTVQQKSPKKKRKDGVYWKRFTAECKSNTSAPQQHHSQAAEKRKAYNDRSYEAHVYQKKPQPRNNSHVHVFQESKHVKKSFQRIGVTMPQGLCHEDEMSKSTHSGNYSEAAVLMEQAQSLDTADRYINCKAAKYMLRAGQLQQAQQMCAKFTREGVDAMQNLNEMQAMWFETEYANACRQMGTFGEALKMCHMIERHFSGIVEDQFDFHTYCVRRMTLSAYIGLLRLEDVLRRHHFYFRAAKCAIKVYLRLYDRPNEVEEHETAKAGNASELRKQMRKKKKQAAKKQAEEEQARAAQEASAKQKASKPDPDLDNQQQAPLDPDQLLKTENPLDEAVKFVQPLLDLKSTELDSYLLGFEIYYRKEKVLPMLQCLYRSQQIDSFNTQLHVQKMLFLRFLETDKEQDECVKELIDEYLPSLFPDGERNVKKLNDKLLAANANSLPHKLAYSMVEYAINANNRAATLKELNRAFTDPQSLTPNCWQICRKYVRELHRGGRLGPVVPRANIDQVCTLYAAKFPDCNYFRDFLHESKRLRGELPTENGNGEASKLTNGELDNANKSFDPEP